jgi:hypothetical protein
MSNPTAADGAQDEALNLGKAGPRRAVDQWCGTRAASQHSEERDGPKPNYWQRHRNHDM